MLTEQVWELVQAEKPLDVIYDRLTSLHWTGDFFAASEQDGHLQEYLTEGEHAVSAFEAELHGIYSDIYRLLEDPNAAEKQRLENDVFPLDEFTLVVFDALSLRELPLVHRVFLEHDIETVEGYALSEVPSETSTFAHRHFGANGPSSIAPNLVTGDFAFRHVKLQNWKPDFTDTERRRVVWALYPDNVFHLDSGAVRYRRHIVEPVRDILNGILANDPVMPVIVTGDHGYLWQGEATPWEVTGDAAAALADAFKQGRCSSKATVELVTRAGEYAWVHGTDAAARGRFAWGGKVKGPTKLFKHGGVSFMECMVPFVMSQ